MAYITGIHRPNSTHLASCNLLTLSSDWNEKAIEKSEESSTNT